jgi:hypothetical protein
VSEKRDLDSLVRIWEHWTQTDLVLRRAVRCTADDSAVHYALQDQVFTRLKPLMESKELSQATAAAVYAGMAVYMALVGGDEIFRKQWHQMCRDARLAHRRALAAVQQQ